MVHLILKYSKGNKGSPPPQAPHITLTPLSPPVPQECLILCVTKCPVHLHVPLSVPAFTLFRRVDGRLPEALLRFPVVSRCESRIPCRGVSPLSGKGPGLWGGFTLGRLHLPSREQGQGGRGRGIRDTCSMGSPLVR